MKVYVKGQGEVSLSQSDFVGSGGEGSVYCKGSTAFKLYHDPNKMIPTGKMQELASITDPDIIKPEGFVVDKKGRPLGYTMRFLKDTLAICQLFPPVFRRNHGITPEMTLQLVQGLRERVQHTHDVGVLVVDLNEMNYVVDRGFTTVYGIDVDSYQTRSYPATAIMPGIRDPQVNGLDWTELSDWFSFAIVSFNLFCGIHPYKGRHPSLNGLDARMHAGVSVFNRDVKLPKVVLPLDVIPEVYRQWYRAVLEDGKRLPPPTSFQGTIFIAPVVRTVKGTDKFDIVELFALGGDIRALWDDGGHTLVWADDGLYLDQRRTHGPVKGILGVGFTPKMGKPIIAGTSGNRLKLLDATTGKTLPLDLRADAVMSHGGRIYLRSQDKLLEVVLNDVGQRVVASTQLAGTCLPHATRLFPGVVLQNLLGRTWMAMFPRSGVTYNLAAPELDEYRIVEARYDNAETPKAESGVLMVVGMKNGKYDRLVFRFDPHFTSYDVRVVEDITPTGLNFVVLDTGVCICMNEEDKLELFSVKTGSASVKLVDDPVLGADMHLFKQGGRVVFPRGTKLQSMRMK